MLWLVQGNDCRLCSLLPRGVDQKSAPKVSSALQPTAPLVLMQSDNGLCTDLANIYLCIHSCQVWNAHCVAFNSRSKGNALLLRMAVKSCCCRTQVHRILQSVFQKAQRTDAGLVTDPKSKQRQAWGGGERRTNETLRMCLMVSAARASTWVTDNSSFTSSHCLEISLLVVFS